MDKMSNHYFDRTTCACERCTACCKRQPGPLAPGDFERIVDYIAKTQNCSREIALSQAKTQFWASPGCIVKDWKGDTFRIGTITPRYARGRCVFLDENDRCKIHEVAPFGCSHFDTHMSQHEAMARSSWLAREQQGEEYQALRASLPYATHQNVARRTGTTDRPTQFN
jgi:Fe-S-cluster containining protein